MFLIFDPAFPGILRPEEMGYTSDIKWKTMALP